jgi:hypothetical protein
MKFSEKIVFERSLQKNCDEKIVIQNIVNFQETRTGNRYQARSNFDVTSFQHQLISSSFSSSRSNRDVTSFRSDMETNGQTDQPTDGPMDGPT